MRENEIIVKTINDLYILNRWKYLVLNKEGNYSTIQYYKNNPEMNKNNEKPLTDWRVYYHIDNKQTLGVFAGYKDNIEISKFMTFDVDVKDSEYAKWVVYKIVNVLQESGIDDEFINVSVSGNKGYHVDLFFTEPVEVEILKQFHKYVLNEADLHNKNYGEVEFRPTLQQGVKIPLGTNFRNKGINNKCWFVDYSNGLKPIRNLDYILKIKKLDTILFRLILDKLFEIESDGTSSKNITDYKYVKEKHTPLKIYQQNVNEDVTVEAIQQLEYEGLTRPGTRHNSLLKLAKYYKYCGLTEDCNEESLIQWMELQNKDMYSTKWDEVLEDIHKIVKYVYEYNCSIVGGVKEVEITYEEIKEILKAKTKNEKLTLYAMLVHSKRYATKQGIFYFPYKLMEQATGLTDKTITKHLNLLEEHCFIEIVSRNKNIIKDGRFLGKETNKYKINLKVEESEKKFTVKDTDNYRDSFNKCVTNWFDNKTIKELCGRRHYEELLIYKDTNIIG